MPVRSLLIPIFLCATLAAQTHVQTPGTPAPDSLIDQLVADSEQYRVRLPSLTADEAIASEGSWMGMFKQHTAETGTFRVIRDSADGPLRESRQIVTMDGKPVDPAKDPHLPIVLFGGFGGFQQLLFTPSHRHCYRFDLLPSPGSDGTVQLAVAALPEPPPNFGCLPAGVSVTGLVRLDPATHQIVHFERTVPDEFANKTRLAPFASVDLAPTKVGDDTFFLPTVVIGRVVNGKVRGSFTAHYSNYHRYTASIKILPDATRPPPPLDPPATPPL